MTGTDQPEVWLAGIAVAAPLAYIGLRSLAGKLAKYLLALAGIAAIAGVIAVFVLVLTYTETG